MLFLGISAIVTIDVCVSPDFSKQFQSLWVIHKIVLIRRKPPKNEGNEWAKLKSFHIKMKNFKKKMVCKKVICRHLE